MEKPNTRDPLNTVLVKKTAELEGVDKSMVYKVISGDRYNQRVLSTYTELAEGIENVFQNQLLKAVNELVPFN